MGGLSRSGAVGPIYPEPAYCLTYWRNKKDGAALGRAFQIAMLNYNDICRNKLLPIEDAAMKTGKPRSTSTPKASPAVGKWHGEQPEQGSAFVGDVAHGEIATSITASAGALFRAAFASAI